MHNFMLPVNGTSESMYKLEDEINEGLQEMCCSLPDSEQMSNPATAACDMYAATTPTLQRRQYVAVRL